MNVAYRVLLNLCELASILPAGSVLPRLLHMACLHLLPFSLLLVAFLTLISASCGGH